MTSASTRVDEAESDSAFGDFTIELGPFTEVELAIYAHPQWAEVSHALAIADNAEDYLPRRIRDGRTGAVRLGQIWPVKLRYTPPALADLDSTLDYISAHSPQGAKRIQAIINLLSMQPHIGVRTDEPAIRRLTTTPYPYLIFYEVTETEIVHAIRHGARDPSGMPGAP